MTINTSAESVLKMLSLYVDKMDYQRLGESPNEDNFSGNFECQIAVNDDGSRAIRLSFVGEDKDYYRAVVRIVGVFMIEEEDSSDDEFNEILFQQNAVAIMFPFLRSQVSLLTTQPGITPLLIPPINIVKLFSKENADKALKEQG
jgi:preprotein translocase subunit SecB